MTLYTLTAIQPAVILSRLCFVQINDLLQQSEPDALEYHDRVCEQIAQRGEWDELTLVDARPGEALVHESVSIACSGERVELYYSDVDTWRKGVVIGDKSGPNGTKHTVRGGQGQSLAQNLCFCPSFVAMHSVIR